jgi:hypothetical protein
MQAPVSGPALRQAAVLATHWNRRDIEAVVLLVAELNDLDLAHDMIVALLMLRDKSQEEISTLVQGVPA